MAKLLIVDDSPDFQEALRLVLSPDFECVTLDHGKEIVEEVEKNKPDLILLDVNLPEMDGFQIFALLQNSGLVKEIPILFISARSDTASKVLGLSLGADDYISKPFDAMELRARIENKIGKNKNKLEREALLTRKNLKLNILTQRAYQCAEGEERLIDLTPHEFKLLLHLARHPGQIFSREQLLNAVWGVEVHVSDRMVDTLISNIRKKLGNISGYVETVISMGYRFDAEAKSRKRAS